MDSTRRIPPTKGNRQRPNSKGNKKRKGGIFTALKIILLVFVFLGITAAAGAWIYVNGIVSKLEPIDPEQVYELLYESSLIIDSKGKTLETIQSEGLRKIVKYDDINKSIVDAFVAVEDKTFETHNGFNVVRMVGATLKWLFKGEHLGGTSTISQQLARNVYLFDRISERTINRKVTEAHYTMQLEKNLTKEQIMEGYLNLVNFGMRSYGIEAASNTYFSKSAKDIDYIEAAILVGIVKGPSYYSPALILHKKDVPENAYIFDDSDQIYTTIFNERAINRYKTCIALMYENKKISKEQYDFAKDYDIRTKIKLSRYKGEEISTYFADIVKQEVVRDLMKKYDYSFAKANNILHSTGLKIECTIDFEMQKQLEMHFEKDNFNAYFGDTLVNAVISFQKNRNLEENGIVDSNLLDRICKESNTNRSSFKEETYQKGMELDDIKMLKNALFKLGYFVTSEIFPSIIIRVDEEGNLLSEETRKLILYKMSSLIDEDKNYIIRDGEYEFDNSGNLILYKNKKLNFYSHYEDGVLKRIQVTIKDSFDFPHNFDDSHIKSGRFTVDSIYSYAGRDMLIPDEFKRFDEDDNLIISRRFIEQNPNFFQISSDNSLKVSKENYVISNIPVVQPQAAMTIIDYRTGHIKAIVGGRNVEGAMLYNRALSPRQPGSAIKPLSVYTAAIDSGKYTAGTSIDDRPVYLSGHPKVRWPVNWYETYKTKHFYHGLMSVRESINISANVPAAIIADDIGVPVLIDYLEKYGITTLVKEGPINDVNISATALGGMSKGVSPLQMTQAFGAIANGGMLNNTISYTKVTNNRGEVILEKKTEPKFVIDNKVAYILTDLLMGVVKDGLATNAILYPGNTVQPVAGKTGSTTNNMDAWFVGFTPYYVGGLWFGNDLNIPLAMGSEFSASFWRGVMFDIHKDLEPSAFHVPDGIVNVTIDRISGKLPSELSKQDPRNTIINEVYIAGTQPTEVDDLHVEVEVCKICGKLASENCPPDQREIKVLVKRPEPYDPKDHNDIMLRDSEYDVPTEECEEFSPEKILASLYYINQEYLGINPTRKLSSGNSVVQRPYPITMLDGNKKFLMPGSVLLKEGDVMLPDGQQIDKEKILTIYKYTADELDEYFQKPTEEETEAEDQSPNE